MVLRGPEGTIIGWSSAHDRAAGRMLLVTVVDRRLDDETADRVAALLFSWAERVAEVIGRRRGLDVQQIDSGAFADDDRQHRWLERAGFTQVRTWWQMTRPVHEDEADLDAEAKPGVRIRPVERQGTGMPDEDDLRTVHEILESAFADHFNSHEETFDEFVVAAARGPGPPVGPLVDRRARRRRRAPSRPGPWSVPSRRARATRRTAATWSTSASCRTPAAAGWPSRC